MKRKYAIILILVLLAYSSSAQFKFLPDLYSQLSNADKIKTWATATGTTSFIANPYPVEATLVDKWDYMDSHPTTWKSIFDFKSVRNIVRIGVNQDVAVITPKYDIKVDVTILKFSPGSSFVLTEVKSLYLSYNPEVRKQYNDLSIYSFTGSYKFQVKITGIYPALSTGGYATTSIAPSDVPANFFIESEIIAQRYDKTPMYISLSSTKSADGRNLEISGGLTTLTVSMPVGFSCYAIDHKPAAYELEWTYIDDYEYDIATGTKTYKFTSAGSIDYDFRKNSTRVRRLKVC